MSPHKLVVDVAYDYNYSPTQSNIISPTNYSPPYGSGPSQNLYGQETPYGGQGDIEQWRVFLTKQRCQAFQISIQEIFDGSFGVEAGAGLTISGLNIIAGFKSKFRTIPSSQSVGRT
jgi:hypothetical protein